MAEPYVTIATLHFLCISVVTAASDGRTWGYLEATAAVQSTDVVRIPDALSRREIEAVQAAADRFGIETDAQATDAEGAKVTRYLHTALTATGGTALHRTLRRITRKLIAAACRVDAAQSWQLLQPCDAEADGKESDDAWPELAGGLVNVRTAEVHVYGAGGRLMSLHNDDSSLVTLDVMLSPAGDFDGGGKHSSTIFVPMSKSRTHF